MSDSSQTSSRTQGGIANKQGKILEDAVISLFSRYGFKEVRHSEWLKQGSAAGDELLIRNAPYTSIYGHNAKTEFLAISKRLKRTIRIECKWQQSTGSVDEKYPYLYLNCVQAMPEDEIVIVLDGGGAKVQAVEWLKNAAAQKWLLDGASSNKRISVMSLAEFMTWANVTLRQ